MQAALGRHIILNHSICSCSMDRSGKRLQMKKRGMESALTLAQIDKLPSLKE